jgi:hypothetical protein
MINDIIYEHLTVDQIDALETHDKATKSDIINCIQDLHNTGIDIYIAIDLAFNAFSEVPNE